MSNIVRISDRFAAPQVALIRRMNPDCNNDEFDQFMNVAADLGLDPLKKQIYAFVFNKDKAESRRLSIVVGIDGFRAVANRSGDYRPDDKAPRLVIDPAAVDEDSNPLGLISAEVTVYKRVHGDWWPITAVAYWDEFAPIITAGDEDEYEWIDTGETWPDSGKPKMKKRLKAGATKKARLDPNKATWRKMPRIMLPKCAEAQAIRRGWPEDLSGVYSDEEIDRARTIDLTASEIVERAAVETRLAMIGGADAITFEMEDGRQRIPIGKAADMLMERFRAMKPHEVLQWRNMNRVELQEFWARNKADALEIKKYLEKVEKESETA